MNEHIGDDAALYALGLLDERERHAIDAHAAGCDACARLLGAAEDDVATLVAAEPQRAALTERVVPLRARRTPWFAAGAAIAAIFIFGLPAAFLWEQNDAMRAGMLADSAAMHQLASGPFRTASFAATSGGSDARVMYAPDGSWYVIVVRGATKALQVAWMHDGERTLLGTAQPHGEVAMLYLPRSHRMSQLALVDGERVVAEAQLAY